MSLRDRVVPFIRAAGWLALASVLVIDIVAEWHKSQKPPVTCICSCDGDAAILTIEP